MNQDFDAFHFAFGYPVEREIGVFKVKGFSVCVRPPIRPGVKQPRMSVSQEYLHDCRNSRRVSPDALVGKCPKAAEKLPKSLAQSKVHNPKAGPMFGVEPLMSRREPDAHFVGASMAPGVIRDASERGIGVFRSCLYGDDAA